MTYMVRVAVVAISLLFLFPLHTTFAASKNSPVGTWTTVSDETGKNRAVVRISERGGVLYGTILKVFKAPGDKDKCVKCPGRFKNKKIVGLQFLWGVKKTGANEWSGGRILDAKKGKIYRVKLSLADGGRSLKVRGYIGFSLLGRTQTWHRR